MLNLKSAQIKNVSLNFLIAYSYDSAILHLAIKDSNGQEKYIPLSASTYRGIPSVNLKISTTKSKDQIWVRSSWENDEVLAYYRLGSDTAITPYGTRKLLDSPFPSTLNGGTVRFPKIDPTDSLTLLDFNYSPEDEIEMPTKK